jgi:hypothetical protein
VLPAVAAVDEERRLAPPDLPLLPCEGLREAVQDGFMDPSADFGQGSGIGVQGSGVTLAGDGDCVRRGAGKIVAEVVERLGLCPVAVMSVSRSAESTISSRLWTMMLMVCGAAAGPVGSSPGGDEDGDEVVLKHTEVGDSTAVRSPK